MDEIKKDLIELCKKHKCCFSVIYIDRYKAVLSVINDESKSFNFIFADSKEITPVSTEETQIKMF